MRLRFLFRQQQEQDALRQTARLLADYFGDVDVTPTDIAGAPTHERASSISFDRCPNLPSVLAVLSCSYHSWFGARDG